MMSQEEEECSEGNPMKRLEDAIFDQVASSGKSKPLSMETISSIKASLINEIFSNKFHCSLDHDHPPYAEMIYKAIEELNKNGDCSNEAALSTYIKSEYHDNLPWAHESLLSLHLRRLSMKGEIIVAEDGCYIFPKLKHSLHQTLLQQSKSSLLLLYNNDDDNGGGNLTEAEAIWIKPLKAVISEGKWAAKDQDLLPKPIKQRRRRKGKEEKTKGKSKSEKMVRLKKLCIRRREVKQDDAN